MNRFLRTCRASSFAALCLLGCGGGTTAPIDAATPVDAGGDTDGGTDAAMRVDSGPFDAGPPEVCPLTYAGCTAIDDHTGEAAVTIAFAGFAYAPRCIRVSAGTVVTIPASSLHPLRSATCSPSGTPLPAAATSAEADYTFSAPGAYGYFCHAHGTNAGSGMAGLIVVE